jgi:hypothetical protein
LVIGIGLVKESRSKDFISWTPTGRDGPIAEISRHAAHAFSSFKQICTNSNCSNFSATPDIDQLKSEHQHGMGAILSDSVSSYVGYASFPKIHWVPKHQKLVGASSAEKF